MNAFKPAFRPAIRPAITSVFGVQVPPLTLTLQPQPKTVDEYSLATFSCEVTGGVAPYSYQWKKNGINLGTNSANLSFTAAATDKNAVITLVVTDSVGKVAYSIPASLTVTRNVVAFNGVSQYLKIPPITLTKAFEIELQVKFGTSPWAPYLSSSSRQVEFRNQGDTGKLEFFGAGIEYTLDGVVIVNGVTNVPLPSSGYHLVTIKSSVASLTETLSSIMSRSPDDTPRASGSIRALKIWTGGDRNTGTLIRDYRMNDGWENNPVCVNSAVGLGLEAWNNNPTSSTAGWTDSGGGSYVCNGTDGAVLVDESNTLVNIETYLVRFKVSNRTAGSVRILAYGASKVGIGTQRGSDGYYTELLSISTGTGSGNPSGKVVVQSFSFAGKVSDITVKKADGYGNYIGLTAASWSKETLS